MSDHRETENIKIVRDIVRLIIDNTNVENRSLSVVKYVINNIVSTTLTGRIEDGYVLAFRA